MIEMDHRFFIWRKPDIIVPKEEAWTHEFWSDFGGNHPAPLAKAISRAEIIRIHGKKHIQDFKHFRATKKKLDEPIQRYSVEYHSIPNFDSELPHLQLYMFFIVERDKIDEDKWIKGYA